FVVLGAMATAGTKRVPTTEYAEYTERDRLHGALFPCVPRIPWSNSFRSVPLNGHNLFEVGDGCRGPLPRVARSSLLPQKHYGGQAHPWALGRTPFGIVHCSPGLRLPALSPLDWSTDTFNLPSGGWRPTAPGEGTGPTGSADR